MKKTSSLVYGGISVALIVLFLYIGSLIVTNKVFLMAVAIAIGAIACIIGGIKSALIVYISASILGFILVPNKLYVGIYIIFGIYPIVKLIAERYSTVLEYIVKYSVFNLLTVITYLIYRNFIYLGPLFDSTYLIIVFFIIIQVVFFIFDYAFTKFIMLVNDRILRGYKGKI